MRDYWNDPPEELEAPECPECHEGYGDEVECEGDKLTFTCDTCGHKWEDEIEIDVEPPEVIGPEDIEEDYPRVPPKCPHGNELGECSHCDHEGDLAYDAVRERRMFRR